ncbi:MAG: Gfo/Idh/MocA family oxidoreductase [Rhodospirillales bacterium]
MSVIRVAVVGAGVIGRTHIETLGKSDGFALSAIVDPAPGAPRLAAEHGVPHFPDIEGLLEARAADAVIVASPNHTHVPYATLLLEAGIPVLLEKPVANEAADAERLVAAVERTGVPLLLGHHRRHNPIIKAAKAAIEAGRIGEMVTAVVNSTLAKPAAYFNAEWRRTPGQGGPLAINMSHEIDLLRHFFGEAASVRAVVSHARRNSPVEDTASAIITFRSGGIASLTISDASCGPWAWDLSAGEAPARFPAHDISAHIYSGTKAGLSLPDLGLWTYSGAEPDWETEQRRETLTYIPAPVYMEQLKQFADVIRKGATPLVTCADGLANMRIIDAMRASAASGREVVLTG